MENGEGVHPILNYITPSSDYSLQSEDGEAYFATLAMTPIRFSDSDSRVNRSQSGWRIKGNHATDIDDLIWGSRPYAKGIFAMHVGQESVEVLAISSLTSACAPVNCRKDMGPGNPIHARNVDGGVDRIRDEARNPPKA